MSTEQQRPGKDSLADFRGPEPAKFNDEPAPTPPVADDDHSARRVAEDDQPAPAPAAKAEEPPKVEPKKGSPFDDKRARMAERFNARRNGEMTDTPIDLTKDETLYGKLAGGDGGDPPPADGGEGDDPAKAPAKPGPSASEGDAKPEPMPLVVNGKTINKSIAEIAALADMTEDEVKADPARARRFAQKELAIADRLEFAKSVSRGTPARTDDAGARPAAPAAHQGAGEAGDDDRGQPPASRDTSVDDVAKLIEDIQIGDPKEVAPKLAEFIANAAKKTAATTVQENEGDRQRRGELQSNISAVKEFLDDHPELADKPAVAPAISARLDDEFRTDLRKAMIAEGESEADVDDVLSRASRDQIRNAHLARRIAKNPNVRQINKGLIGDVYAKVRADFGVTDAAPKPQALSREQRKENLPHQPRRASVPPASNTPPAKDAPMSRRAVVAEMAQRTGRKPSRLPS